ncbi:GPW/gp25 family protein [Ideonella sp. 4Y11]|uniref:GPW/gp25 family protein n=1 Tax=Ideonella aquatica TaxID=2824119 RepID=A0A941BNY8_9BURK|nr:GPW/gp25 family protein [Ideonella aquatica]MBQ0957495.1 GPW/gp25 family protein [Ideonella aquatica]
MSSGLQQFDRLGAGLGQPLAPDERGALPQVAGPEKVRQAMLTILDTDPGERLMRPAFGCGLRRWLMAPNNATTRTQITREIEQALARWEPRITVQAVDVAATNDPSTVLIEIHYAHVLDARQDVLVYPFYLAT